MTAEDLEELKQDRRQEAAEEEYYEKKMYNDEEFCVECFEPEIAEAVDILREISNKLEKYGHTYSMQQLIEDY